MKPKPGWSLPGAVLCLGVLALVASGCSDDPDLGVAPDDTNSPEAVVGLFGGGLLVECPDAFKEECDCDYPAVQCSCSQLDSQSLSEHLDQSDHWDGSQLDFCEAGTSGIEQAVSDGNALMIDQWGSCPHVDGMHLPSEGTDPGTILVRAGMSPEDATKTQWHEGWSYEMCGDAETEAEMNACHFALDYNENQIEEACYGDSQSFPIPV